MTKFREPVKQPCNDCPFRRESVPGWLGHSSPEGFLDCIQRDEPLPCHQTIDYEDRNWLAEWMLQRSGNTCAGALVFMANKVQRAKTPGFPTMPSDHKSVFSNSVEFVRHHREAPVHSWDEDDQNDGAKLHRQLVAQAAKAIGKPIVDFKNAIAASKRKVKP